MAPVVHGFRLPKRLGEFYPRQAWQLVTLHASRADPYRTWQLGEQEALQGTT